MTRSELNKKIFDSAQRDGSPELCVYLVTVFTILKDYFKEINNNNNNKEKKCIKD